MNETSPALIQCQFCLSINALDTDDPDKPCPNCGVVPKHLPGPPIEWDEADLELIDEESEDTERPKTSVGVVVLASVLGVVAPVLLAGVVGLSIWSASGGDLEALAGTATVEKVPELEVSLEGWEATPKWTADIPTEEVTESGDGKWLGVITGDNALIIDAATGATVATQSLGADATSQVHRAGDKLIVADTDTVYLWNGDATLDTEADATGWHDIALDDDATLTLRGDVAFVVTEVGATYDIISDDATLTPVKVPTPGAVPVAATSDTITWGTNSRVAYVTGHDGKSVSDAKLEAPHDDATIARWVGGDATHVYVAWEMDDAISLVIHDTQAGDILDSSPFKELDKATLVTTRNGAAASIDGLLINTTTGAITPLEYGDATTTVGDDFVVINEDIETLVDVAGAVVLEVGDSARPVAVTSEGNLVVSVGEELAAIPPSQGAPVRGIGYLVDGA